MEIRYPAMLEPQVGGGLFVRFPDFDNIFTEGDTEEAALFNASEVLTGMLNAKIEDGDQIPVPSAAEPGVYMIAPDPKAQAALLVRFTRGDRPLADVARALGTSWPSATRVFPPGEGEQHRIIPAPAGNTL